MIRFLARRLVHSVAVLLLISALAFVLQQAAPGNYFDEMRLDPAISVDTVAAWKARYGLNAPLAQRYGAWLLAAVRGDWGVSFAYGTPVRQLIWPRALNTLLLTSVAMAISWALALAAGSVAGYLDSRATRSMSATASALAMSAPEAITALAVVLVAMRTGLWRGSSDGKPSIALPATALVIVNAPVLFRYVRIAVVEARSATFIDAARASGLRGATLFGHVMRAGANPLISVAGLSIGGLLSTSLIAETVTGWPGLGSLMLEAVFSRDVFVVMASVLLSAALYIAGSFLADVALYASDPRIRRVQP